MTALDEYQTVREKITGDVVVTRNTQFNQIEANTVVVEAGVKARLYGIVYRKLVICKDAKVFLHGRIQGDIDDLGGRFYYFDE